MTTRPAAPAPPLTAEEEATFRESVRNVAGIIHETGDDWTNFWSNRTAERLLATLDRDREARADERARHNAELRAAVLAIPDHQVSGREWEWGCDYRIDKRFPNCAQDNPEHDHDLISRDRVLALLADPPS